jgi:PAS domain S-box-containing protein
VLELSINGIHLHDADRDALVPTATTEKADAVIGEAPAFERGESAAWDAFESGEAKVYDDVRATRNVHNSETDIRSEYHLPLGDHGVFLAGSVEPNAFDDRTVSMAQILASNVEAALDRLDREIELRDTSERLRTIIEHTPDALFVLDDDERIIEANEQAYTSLGYERDELLGMSHEAIGTVQNDQEAGTVDPLAPLRRDSERVLTKEGRHVRKDGTEFPVRVRVARIEHDREGRFLAIARDISEIETKKRKLRRQNENLEAFAGIVSHDLRNPLTVARTGVELARRTGEGYGESLDRVENAHERMETLIEDLLALARNGQSIDEGDIEPLELSSVLTQGWNIVSTASAELHVEDDATVLADGSRLRQLVENLFRNSVEHSSPSSPTGSNEDTVTIRVGTLPNGFYIEDDGPGIPESEREKIFEPGYSTRDDGTGFGLGIVRNVVEAHGWDIAVTDSADDGARFEITGVETARSE